MNRLPHGLTLRFLLLGVLPLTLLLAGISIASISLDQNTMHRLVNDLDVRTVISKADSIGACLQHKSDVLQLIAGEVASSTRPPVIGPYEAGEFTAGIALYDKGGALVASTAPAAGWAASALSNPTFSLPMDAPASQVVVWNNNFVLRAHDSAHNFTVIGLMPVSELQFDTLVNPPSNVSAMGSIGAMNATNDASHSPVGNGSSVSAFLINAGEEMVASAGPDRAHTDPEDRPGAVEVLHGLSGGMYATDPDNGEEDVIAYAPVVNRNGPTGLGMIIEEPWQVMLNPLMNYVVFVPLMTLPVLLLTVLMIIAGVRRIVLPLEQLDRQAREIGRGNYTVLDKPVNGIDEVEQLQSTLRTMAGQLRADQERLRNYARAVTETQEAERKRLARELHDDTIQSLIVLSQRIQLMRPAVAPAQPQLVAKLDDLRRLVLQMIDDVRRFSRALRPIYLDDAGLVAALERMALEVNATVQSRMPAVPGTRDDARDRACDGAPYGEPVCEGCSMPTASCRATSPMLNSHCIARHRKRCRMPSATPRPERYPFR